MVPNTHLVNPVQQPWGDKFCSKNNNGEKN